MSMKEGGSLYEIFIKMLNNVLGKLYYVNIKQSNAHFKYGKNTSRKRKN